MNREVHVRFWESARVKLPRATHHEAGLSQEEFQVWPGKSNLKENTRKGKLTLSAFYAVDYLVGKEISKSEISRTS